jgi:NDP-sugar pyrophosphorylase family protein
MCLKDIDICILCGGLGTRLAATLGDTPKVLAPIGDSTYIDILITRLKSFGARRFVLAAGHLSQKVVSWAWERELNGPDDEEINVSIESESRGTTHALLAAKPLLHSDPVLVIHGDTLTNANMCRFLEIYRRYGLETAHLWSKRYGRRDFGNAGYYLISQKAMAKKMHPSFALHMTKECEGLGQVDIYRSFFLDIGTPKTLAQAPDFLEFMKIPDYVPEAAR